MPTNNQKAMTWRDLSYRAANALDTVRASIHIERGIKKPVPDWDKMDFAVLLAFKPHGRNYPFETTGGDWHFGEDKFRSVDDKTFRAFLNAGLYEQPRHLPENQVSILTEWGLELLATGKTTPVKDRIVGESKTYEKYKSLFLMPKEEMILNLTKGIESARAALNDENEQVTFRP